MLRAQMALMHSWLRPALVSVIAFTTACGSDDIQIEGSYRALAVWDFSEPFGRDGIGGAFADLLIEETVSTAVPGFVEDDAIELTSSLVRGPVKALVESRLPEELREDGVVLAGLRDALGSIDVETELVLTDDVEGTETLSALSFNHSSGPFRIASDRLPAGITVDGRFEGGREDIDRVELDRYNLEIHFGEFILILVGELLGQDVDALTAATQDAIGCDEVVAEMTGGDDSFDISVAGQDISISAGALDDACSSVKSSFAEYAIGLVHLDAGVELGGMVTLLDEDGDGKADTLSSDAEYEGRLTLFPGPFDPKFFPTFVATRE